MTQPVKGVSFSHFGSIDSVVSRLDPWRGAASRVWQPHIEHGIEIMAQENVRDAELRKSREVAESSRETEWQGAGFLRELFLGTFRLDLIDPYPLPGEERPEFTRFYEALSDFLRKEVDPVQIDERGELPPQMIEGLRRLGAFGMKVPVEYGGLGFSHVEYGKVMKLLGSHDANLTALLSAHQSIGVPQPL